MQLLTIMKKIVALLDETSVSDISVLIRVLTWVYMTNLFVVTFKVNTFTPYNVYSTPYFKKNYFP